MTSTAPEDHSHALRISFIEHILILAAAAVIIAAVLQASPLQSANDRSRWATVWSLVERRTFQIDEIDAVGRWSTIDKVRYRTSPSEPWHFYSSKPPLLSTLVAALYATERATLGYGLFNDTAFVTRLLLMFVNVMPFYLAMCSLSRCLQIFGSSLASRIFVLAVAGFGSILNPYLTTLNNHTPAVACAMFAITSAARIFCGRWNPSRNLFSRNSREPVSGRSAGGVLSQHEPAGKAPRPFDFASLGFFTALTCCFELPAAQMAILAFVAAFFISRRWALIWFLPAAAIPLVAFFATNWVATGGVKPFYATYGSETYVYEHNGIPSYWSNPRDLDANTESPPVYLFHCVLGHHGLLSLTPVLCVTLLGWWISVAHRENAGSRLLILAGALMTLITLGFYLTRTQNYNYGGNSVGLRWMLWLSPFWWIAMVPALQKFSRRGFTSIAAVLLLSSMVSVGWSMNRPWRPSWLFEQMEAAGWISYRTPVKPFDPRHSTVLGSIPAEDGTSMTWRCNDGRYLTFTVTGRADASQNKTVRAMMDISGTRQTVLIDRSKMLSGQPVENFMAPDSRGAQGDLSVLQDLLRGLPESRYFNAAGPAWIPSKSDPQKAWKVERGAARVIMDDRVFGRCWHRCDVFYCDQLPFGVLQWKTSVTSEATGEVLSTSTWIAENY